MVGAGFSKNAAPIVGVNNTFPDWRELGSIFFERVYGSPDDNSGKFLNPLKLAEEVEVLFGRSTLNNLLADNIPDNSHKPTKLFTKLLRLEWRDVFTTNFDTLLERAKDEITERNYQVVLNKEDIINSKSPRIIKLHGSFRSQTPYIITEEDYRIYPQVFAPFVNTVQQALLETTLCLIGFSGDDPNFLKWIGWIRDQFDEDTTSKIYLINSKGFSESEKRLFSKRNINIVDLGNCPDVNEDRAKAIERFVDYLAAKKTKQYWLDWPHQALFQSTDTDDHKSVQLEKTIENWKRIREEYPRWRIVPKENRRLFYTYEREHNDLLKYIKENLNSLNQIDIQYVFEYSWQLDKSLLPFPDDFAELAESCLYKYRPFQVGDSSNSEFQNSFTWNSVKNQWVQISIYMLRYYREEGGYNKWDQCESDISKIWNQLTEEQVASILYERSLQKLFKLNIAEFENCLNDWPNNQSLPYIEAKRAGLLAEVGRLEEAQKILETSLNLVRKKQNLKPVSQNYADVSDEAYLMLSLQCVKQSLDITTNDCFDHHTFKEENSERFNHLHQFKCSPWEELSNFSIRLERPYASFKQLSKKDDFRIGKVTTTQHFMVNDYDALEGYSFLRFCEDIGLPFRLPGLNIGVKSAKGSLSRIGQYSPHWAFVTLIRVGDIEVVKQIYNREYVHQMSNDRCDSVIQNLLNTLGEAKNRIATETSLYSVGLSSKLAETAPIILSRLCCKASYESKQNLLGFIVDVYSSEHKSKYKGIAELMRLLFDSMSKEHQIRSIPSLLNIQIPENLNLITEREYLNPFATLQKYDAPIPDRKAIPNARISYFINKVKSNDQKVRNWAIYTLGFLCECKLLSDKQKNQFVSASWTQLDDYGFPNNTYYLKHFWLDFKHYENCRIKQIFEHYVSEFKISHQSEWQNRNIALNRHTRFRDIANELIGAQQRMQFDQQIYELWWNKIQSWWQCDKRYLRHPDQKVVEEFQTRFAILVTIVSKFILPNLTTSNQFREHFELLVSDLKSYGLPTAYIKAASVKVTLTDRMEILSEIRKQLTESNQVAIQDALRAVWCAAQNEDEVFNLDEQRNLVAITLDGIIWRKNEVVGSALYKISQIVEFYPELINQEIESLILLALDRCAKYSEIENELSVISLEEKLNIRKKSACLAHEFSLWYGSQRREVPREITEWKYICESPHEFAEVKNQWITH